MITFTSKTEAAAREAYKAAAKGDNGAAVTELARPYL